MSRCVRQGASKCSYSFKGFSHFNFVGFECYFDYTLALLRRKIRTLRLSREE